MRAVIFCMLLAVFGTGWAVAQDDVAEVLEEELATQPSDEEVSRRALSLFTDLMSPYCPGASLRDCGSGQATILRDRVRGWIKEGKSDQEITDELVAEFGETILGKPKFKGFGSVAYIAPIAALLIGLFAISAFLRRQKGKPAQRPADAETNAASTGGNEQLRRRLEEELRVHSGG